METNGEKRKGMPEAVAQILRQATVDDSTLLLDLESKYPLLRALLLGGDPESGKAPAAVLTVSRASSGVMLRLAVAPLGVVVDYDCTSLFGTLECIELDLENGSVQWRETWSKGQQRRRAWETALKE